MTMTITFTLLYNYFTTLTLEEESYALPNVWPQTVNGYSGAWYRGVETPKPTMLLKTQNSNKHKCRINNCNNYNDGNKVNKGSIVTKEYNFAILILTKFSKYFLVGLPDMIDHTYINKSRNVRNDSETKLNYPKEKIYYQKNMATQDVCVRMVFVLLYFFVSYLNFTQKPLSSWTLFSKNQATFVNMKEQFTVYLEMVVESTTDDQISKVFKNEGVTPKSVRYETNKNKQKRKITQLTFFPSQYNNQAFINFETEA